MSSRVWLSDEQIRHKKLGGCSRTSLHRYRRDDPDFPRPRRYVGRNLTPEDEIDEYLATALGEPPRPPALEQVRNRAGQFAALDQGQEPAAAAVSGPRRRPRREPLGGGGNSP